MRFSLVRKVFFVLDYPEVWALNIDMSQVDNPSDPALGDMLDKNTILMGTLEFLTS